VTSANTSAITHNRRPEARTIGPDYVGDDVECPVQSYGYTISSSPRTSRK
jgi:hypothetical protein